MHRIGRSPNKAGLEIGPNQFWKNQLGNFWNYSQLCYKN